MAKVRAVNTTVPLGVFILCGAGSDRMSTSMSMSISTMLGDTFLGGLFGEPAWPIRCWHSLMPASTGCG